MFYIIYLFPEFFIAASNELFNITWQIGWLLPTISVYKYIMIKNQQTIVCTICCREKDRSDELLPAIRRYRSNRIDAVAGLAREAGRPLVILSGKYGLIDEDELIPYYDRLMGDEDLGEIIAANIAFLEKNKVEKVIFLCPDPAIDPHVQPYLRSIQASARGTGCKLETIFLPPMPESLIIEMDSA